MGKEHESTCNDEANNEDSSERIEQTKKLPTRTLFTCSSFWLAQRGGQSSIGRYRHIFGERGSRVRLHQTRLHTRKDLCLLRCNDGHRAVIGLLKEGNQLLILWCSLFW